jgi:uncharacterized protein (TIGR00251 family)
MAETGWLHDAAGGIHIELKVQSGASKTETAGLKDGRLKVRIAAAPEDGRANAELRRFLAAALGCSRSEVVLLRGEKSRLKTVCVPLSCRARAESLAWTGADGNIASVII